MHYKKLPITRRDRFRQLKAEASKKAKDQNQNQGRSDENQADEHDGFVTITTNSWSANGQGTGQSDGQHIALRSAPLDHVDSGRRDEDVADVAPTRIGLNNEKAAVPSLLDILAGILGIGFFAYDVFTDVRLAYVYFMDGKSWWFGLTTMFIVLPAAVMTAFNLCFYMMDMFVVKDSVSVFRWLLRASFSMVMLGPLIRMLETLDYALRSFCSCNETKRREYANRYIDAEVDNALIGMLEAFMEAGPQVVLQLCVFEVIGWTTDTTVLVTHQLKSIGSSLWMLAWATVRFQKAVITSQSRDQDLSICQSLVYFIRSSVFMCLWRLFTISGRVLALATFASCFSWWVVIVIAGHYMMMLIWICNQPTQFFMHIDENGKKKHDRCLEAAFKGFAAFIHIFAFLNLIDGHTRLRAVLFYCIMYMENCALIGLWYFYGRCSSMGEIGITVVLVTVLGGFWIGIGCMGLHYMCCHSNRKLVKCCIPNADLYLCKDPPEEHTEAHSPMMI